MKPVIWGVFLALGLVSREVAGELIHLKNGDIFHGEVVTMTATSVTIKTDYGRLLIPKSDLEKVVYEEGKGPQASPLAGGGGKPDGSRPANPTTSRPTATFKGVAPTRPLVTVEIRGRSFWYAWQGNAIDPRIRLHLVLRDVSVAELVDAKPDTVDRNSVYNSFTFSPTDSQVTRTADGYACSVETAVDGKVVLRLELPNKHPLDEQQLDMVYQINDQAQENPQWVDVVTRSFPVQVKTGKQTQIVLQQDASGLDFSGLVKKKMKNVESFGVNVVSFELRDRQPEPTGSTR